MSKQFRGTLRFNGAVTLAPASATLLMGEIGDDKREAADAAADDIKSRFADNEPVVITGTEDPTGNEPAIWVENIQSAAAQSAFALTRAAEEPLAKKATARKAAAKEKASKKTATGKATRWSSAKKAARAAKTARTVKKAAKRAPKRSAAKNVAKKSRTAVAVKKSKNDRKGGR